MRYIHFITAFIVIFAATSCYVDDVEYIEVPSEGRDEITVVARIARFDDHVVDTRGTKNEAEANVTCMAVAIFPIVDDKIGNCVFYDFKEGSQLLFKINRQEKKDGAYIYNKNEPYVMYVFANHPSMTEETCANLTLDQMKAMAYSVESVNVPTNGFPMVGSLGDTITPEGDGKTFILKPGSDTNPTLPLVGGEESDLLNVPMKALFAKVNFTIKVTPDETVDTHLTPQFALNSYSVHNVPALVDFAMGGYPRLDHSVTDDLTSVVESFVNPMPLLNGTKIARGTQTINFTVYLPERFLTPTYQSHDGSKDGEAGYYDYPFPIVDGKYRDQDLDSRQRFKPLLPDGQAATYVTINGTFRDHQQHEFNVTYDVYLGEDNYGNFDTERNSEYSHYINIRGILNSDDQVDYDPNKEMPVSIDHRVNVNRVEQPIIINLRRETKLDSHFEVRPLRIRKNPKYEGDLSDAKVKIEVIYGKEPVQKWIGLERSFGNGDEQSSSSTYLVSNNLAEDRQNSKGKRKYFTTDLTYNTLSAEAGELDEDGYSTKGGQSVIVPISDNDEAVWIYVDEALSTEAADDVRKATIRVSVAEDGTNYDTPIDYVIQQRQLFPVKNGDNTYLIEYEEEYLYNYDAEDSYGQTKEEGMQWGLNGKQLSYKYRSFKLSEDNEDWTDFVKTTLLPTYDFYIEKHDTFAKSNGADMVHNYAGYEFTKEIAQNINADVKHLTMAEQANGAVEYCYNRNKRQADGTIKEEDMVWYLPSADELEDFIVPAYGTFKEFQDNYYWTSQPAYIKNIFYYEYTTGFLFWKETTTSATPMYIDNTEYARATKVARVNGEYDYIKSGLMTEPDNFVPRTESGYTNLGCFYEMPRWKNGTYDIATKSTADDNSNPKKVIGSRNGDERYTDTKNNNAKYFVHLGHLDDLMQEGYHPRTKSNRVRCVRKM